MHREYGVLDIQFESHDDEEWTEQIEEMPENASKWTEQEIYNERIRRGKVKKAKNNDIWTVMSCTKGSGERRKFYYYLRAADPPVPDNSVIEFLYRWNNRCVNRSEYVSPHLISDMEKHIMGYLQEFQRYYTQHWSKAVFRRQEQLRSKEKWFQKQAQIIAQQKAQDAAGRHTLPNLQEIIDKHEAQAASPGGRWHSRNENSLNAKIQLVRQHYNTFKLFLGFLKQWKQTLYDNTYNSGDNKYLFFADATGRQHFKSYADQAIETGIKVGLSRDKGVLKYIDIVTRGIVKRWEKLDKEKAKSTTVKATEKRDSHHTTDNDAGARSVATTVANRSGTVATAGAEGTESVTPSADLAEAKRVQETIQNLNETVESYVATQRGGEINEAEIKSSLSQAERMLEGIDLENVTETTEIINKVENIIANLNRLGLQGYEVQVQKTNLIEKLNSIKTALSKRRTAAAAKPFSKQSHEYLSSTNTVSSSLNLPSGTKAPKKSSGSFFSNFFKNFWSFFDSFFSSLFSFFD